jgi:hypothetical protein
MYSVVVTSATLPFQPRAGLDAEQVERGRAALHRISLRPQPVSWPAWPSMKPAGIPLDALDLAAAALWRCTKAAWLLPGFSSCRSVTAARRGLNGVATAVPVAGAAGRRRPSAGQLARDHVRQAARHARHLDGQLLVQQVGAQVPAGLSSMPDFIVASRMLLISSRMNSDSNCLAASLIASGRVLPRLQLERVQRPAVGGQRVGGRQQAEAMVRSPPARHSGRRRP